ncbi:hypothetical protein PINS_up022167 [Pythium insidiosum]|nr:hypothetical protein PINS_up022166 [Pythium insidiosum]GLE10156.1 hypothetical protein PINS_up022167 [Pythium insidiosum]
MVLRFQSVLASAFSLLGLLLHLDALALSVNAEHVQYQLRRGEIPVRSVNLGSWLVAEHWMSWASPAWEGLSKEEGRQGEYRAMQILGERGRNGTAQFEKHWATWITEKDIEEIAKAGLNAVRVPVGFWIVNDDPSTESTEISRVYAKGGLKYLDKLINEWAVKYNLAVMLSLHAHQGSQNGYDHSAPQTPGQMFWSNSPENFWNSVQFATFLAARYRKSPAYLGMNVMNEPALPTNLDIVKSYYYEVYNRIRDPENTGTVTDDSIIAVSPLLSQQAPGFMMDFMNTKEYMNVWFEWHSYFIWGYEGFDDDQIIQRAKDYKNGFLKAWSGIPMFIGEWCLQGPPKATFEDVNKLRRFGADQLDTFKAAKSGWAFWSWRHDDERNKTSGWSMRQLLKEKHLDLTNM